MQDPILRKLKGTIDSGATSLEKISVVLGISFYTVRAWLVRDSISQPMVQLLKSCKIITEEDCATHRIWREKKRSQRSKHKKRSPKFEDENSETTTS